MISMMDQYEYNVAKGPYFEGETSLPDNQPDYFPLKYIAYYLPQFHAIKENDTSWGVGFTEWTNTTKALPRFVGHYQPRLPSDLGFYDLSSVEALRRQVSLARRGGIYGFCIHHYWFSGHEVLETPLRNLIENPDIDMPFCLNWANESWSRRWDGSESDIILEQRYDPGDDLRYAQSILHVLQDPRYIKIDGRPLIMLYRPSVVPNLEPLLRTWRDFFIKSGVGNPYIIMPQAFGDDDPAAFGMDAAAGFPPHKLAKTIPNARHDIRMLDPAFVGQAISYDRLAAEGVRNRPQGFRLFPGVCPSWDNEARKPKRGSAFFGSTPAKYGRWLKAASEQALAAPSPDERIVFINAWNEWAEGTYLEPDRHFGFAYLAETRRTLDGFVDGAKTPTRAEPVLSRRDQAFVTRTSSWNHLRNALIRLWRTVFKPSR